MKKIKKKKLLIIVLLFFVILILFLMGLYGYSLHAVSKNSEEVSFVVNPGDSKLVIAKNLKTAGLVRSQYALVVYLFFNSDMNLQEGTYTLNRNMDVSTILNKIHKGEVQIDTVTFTFVEGKNMNDLIKLITENFSYTEEEVVSVLNDKEYIQKLVEKYDFLTDEVLNGNIYYALEGYLYPDTYQVLENATLEEILEKMLENTKIKLSGFDFSGTEYSIHEILSMASIVELEAVNESDRSKVAQVIYKRLKLGKGLGSDVTTYYAVKKNMGDTLYMSDLKTINPYNTSEMNTSMAGKLPVGPICNPSLSSIEAVLNPSDTDYEYFVANTCTGEMFFTNTGIEHLQKVNELKSVCATN